MAVGTLSLVQKGQNSGCSRIVVYGGGNIVFGPKRSNLWCPHHHRPLFHCIHCVHWFDLLHQRQCSHHHIPLFYCVHWFDLFCTKDNVPTTIYHYSTASTAYCIHSVLHLLCTASTSLFFLHQGQCLHHHIPLFHCVHCILHPLV